MMLGLSLRKTAKICNLQISTAFAWRHKILDALKRMANEVVFEGIVEADETFFAISYNGNHNESKNFKMPRPPRKTAEKAKKRGMSSEKVCVPCAVNRSGLSVAKIGNLGRSLRKIFTLYSMITYIRCCIMHRLHELIPSFCRREQVKISSV